MVEAKIVADSLSPDGVRLTTMELCYPRFIHSEFMTHRVFSRNASSSRAIPVEKVIEQVRNNPAMPVHWGKNQPGMQAREEIQHVKQAEDVWGWASSDAIASVEHLSDLGLHKQVANRLLEPFQHIKVIVTATEWDNFFKLRLHPDAQPEMMVLAERIKEAMEGSSTKKLEPGEWHLPYVEFDVISRGYFDNNEIRQHWYDMDSAVKCSVARCARVSYLNHDNSTPDIEKDIALADRLLKDGHMSPFEHQATPMDFVNCKDQVWGWPKGVTHVDRFGDRWSSNFRGWIQHRNLLWK